MFSKLKLMHVHRKYFYFGQIVSKTLFPRDILWGKGVCVVVIVGNGGNRIKN